jgi:hypothetical protein
MPAKDTFKDTAIIKNPKSGEEQEGEHTWDVVSSPSRMTKTRAGFYIKSRFR